MNGSDVFSLDLRNFKQAGLVHRYCWYFVDPLHPPPAPTISPPQLSQAIPSRCFSLINFLRIYTPTHSIELRVPSSRQILIQVDFALSFVFFIIFYSPGRMPGASILWFQVSIRVCDKKYMLMKLPRALRNFHTSFGFIVPSRSSDFPVLLNL